MSPINLLPNEDSSFEQDDLATLEIREVDDGSGSCYFYDTARGRVIKHFILAQGPRAALMCDVVVIKKPEALAH